MQALLTVLFLLLTDPMPLEVVRADKGFTVTNRVLFVVDTSGSMKGSLDNAVASVQLITQAGKDGMEVGLITFTDQPIRWEGVPYCTHKVGPHLRDCTLHGWARAPANYKEFNDHLTASAASGLTRADKAIELAMKDPTPGLTIVLVTDGDFWHPTVIKKIQEMRAYRLKHKLARVGIMVWGVGPQAKKLADIAKEGGGGLWVTGKRSGPW